MPKKGYQYASLADRFDAKVEKHDSDCPCCGGCWLWTGAITSAGYGHIQEGGRGGRRLLAHRYSYERNVGPIPVGKTIDHVEERGCRHRRCVNPDHLEPVSKGENTRRGSQSTVIRFGRCKRGHIQTAENVRLRPDGRRHSCERCRLDDRRRV